jgi:hypothetical protein
MKLLAQTPQVARRARNAIFANARRNIRKTSPHSTRLLERLIHVVHDQRLMLMLDRDLATLYGVETGMLIQAIMRNAVRFPEDFMFRLSKATLKNGGHRL